MSRSWTTVATSSFSTRRVRSFWACCHTSSLASRSSNMISLKPPWPIEESLFQVLRVLWSGSL